MAPLPKKDGLSLVEGTRHVAETCGVEDQAAQTALADALRDGALTAWGSSAHRREPIPIEDWRAASIDWNASRAGRRSAGHSVQYRRTEIEISRRQIDGWIQRAQPTTARAQAAPRDVEYWKQRSRLELRIIIDEIMRRRKEDAPQSRAGIDLNKFFKDAMESGALAWDTPKQTPNGPKPYLASGVEYANLRKFVEGIGNQEILGFCEAWAEGKPVWDAIAGLSTHQLRSPPRAATVSANRGGRPPRFNKAEFMAEIIRQTSNDPDGLPERHVLAKTMAEWCLDKWGEEPGETTMKNWLREIYNQPPRLSGEGSN
jgi:hypothetical protein